MSDELKDRDVISLAVSLVDARFFGFLTTIAPDGYPHTRCMAAVMGHEGLHRLYSLTTRGTRKLEHLQAHSQVCWLFTEPTYETVVKLTGEARAFDSALLTGQIWDHLAEHARYYTMEALSQQADAEYQAVESRLSHLEVICPSRGLVTPRLVTLSE